MGVRGNEPSGRTVQPTELILISVEGEFCALQNYREFFFSFQVMHFLKEKIA